MDRLVLDHAHIPKIVAHEWCQKVSTLDRDDLIGALNLALTQAAHAYNPDRGEFSPYAWARIRGAALDYMRAADWLSRKDRAALRDGTKTAADVPQRPTSLDELTEFGWDAATPGDFTDDACWRVDTIPALHRAIRALPPRERHVIVQRYWHETRSQDVAAAMGVDPSRVSQLHTAALRRLRTLTPRTP